ncbi:hypothetical protein A2U01_0078526, partial [Trifolium medium]|nr:hypothetical protein [Trifolium medium]
MVVRLVRCSCGGAGSGAV